MQTRITEHERKSVERRIAAIREELKTIDEGHLTRAFQAQQWERLLDELADLQERLN